MKARPRMIVVALGLLAGADPALAQNSTAPAQNEVIGPPQLRDFSLNGTVSRPATTPAQPQQAPRQPSPAPTVTQPRGGGTVSASRAGGSAADTTQAGRSAPRSSATVELPAPTPAKPIFLPPAAEETEPSLPAEQSRPSGGLDSGKGFASLQWLIAALALAGAGAWFLFRRRAHGRLAGTAPIDLFEQEVIVPPPPVRSPPAARHGLAPTASTPVAPSGVVSSRLRPWLEIQFTPARLIVDDNQASLEFEVAVFNSGSAPARGVLVEGSLFNAGALQDQQIQAFFARPAAEGEKIASIPPLQRITLRSAVFLPREQLRPIEFEGRPLFVPLAAFNATYGWSGGSGQTSVSYVVGKTTQSDKLAPFRLDLGPRMFRNLAARDHDMRVRN